MGKVGEKAAAAEYNESEANKLSGPTKVPRSFVFAFLTFVSQTHTHTYITNFYSFCALISNEFVSA